MTFGRRPKELSKAALLSDTDRLPTGADEFHRTFDDPVALRDWLELALPRVYGFVFARCGADEALAQDLTQETMVEVVRHRHDFDGGSEPMTWVCGIARHKIADHFRAKYRDDRLRLRLIDTSHGVSELGDGDIVTHEAVVEALKTLPDQQRVALALHYLDEMSVRQIADHLGRSESAVESLLARGRETFKKVWGRGEAAK